MLLHILLQTCKFKVYLDNGTLHNDFLYYLKQEHKFPNPRVAKLVLKKDGLTKISWLCGGIERSHLLPPGPIPFTIPNSPVYTSVSDSVPDTLGTEGTFIELKGDAKERSGIDENTCTQ